MKECQKDDAMRNDRDRAPCALRKTPARSSLFALLALAILTLVAAPPTAKADSFHIDALAYSTNFLGTQVTTTLNDITVTNSSLSETEFRALMRFEDWKTLGARFKAFSADSVVVGAVSSQGPSFLDLALYSMLDFTMKNALDGAYQTIHFDHIHNGLVEKISCDGFKGRQTLSPFSMNGDNHVSSQIQTEITHGPMQIDAYNVPDFLLVLFNGGGDAASPLLPIYDRLRITHETLDMRVVIDTNGVLDEKAKITYKREAMEFGSLSLRQGTHSIYEELQATSALLDTLNAMNVGAVSGNGALSNPGGTATGPSQDNSSLNREKNRIAASLFLALGTVFGNAAQEKIHGSGMSLDVSFPALSPQNAHLALDDVTLANFSNNKIDTLELKGLTFQYDKTRLALGKSTLSAMDYSKFYSGITTLLESQNSPASPDLPIAAFNALPSVEKMDFNTISFSTPALGSAQTQGWPDNTITFSLQNVHLEHDAFKNFMPTHAAIGLDHFMMALPKNNPILASLSAMGYSALDVSAHADATIHEPDHTLDVSDISVEGAGMGKAALGLSFADAGDRLFSSNLWDVKAAFGQLALARASFFYKDDSLFNRVLAFVAEGQNVKPEDLRKELALTVSLALPSVLGASNNTKVLGEALEKFIEAPKSLNIRVTAHPPLHYGDLRAFAAPSELMDRITLDASANP